MPQSSSSADVVQDHDEKLRMYTEMVEETIDLNELANHNYMLLPTLDNELQKFKDELIGVRDDLDEEHRRVGEDLGVDIEKKLHLENHQVYKYSFRITKAVSASQSIKPGCS
jgi:DNA mismatch repair protein MSH2